MSNVFDLDALEREGTKDSFVVKVGGKSVTFRDPQDLDWQDVSELNADNPVDFVHAVVAKDDADHFFSCEVPAWKLNKLFEAYLDHYGITQPGEAPALSGTSKGTARRSK